MVVEGLDQVRNKGSFNKGGDGEECELQSQQDNCLDVIIK